MRLRKGRNALGQARVAEGHRELARVPGESSYCAPPFWIRPFRSLRRRLSLQQGNTLLAPQRLRSRERDLHTGGSKYVDGKYRV